MDTSLLLKQDQAEALQIVSNNFGGSMPSFEK
jgi:hypothetical protein